MKKDCDFCKKTREKILKKADNYIKFYNNIQQILDMKKIFNGKKDIVYNYTSNFLNKSGKNDN